MAGVSEIPQGWTARDAGPGDGLHASRRLVVIDRLRGLMVALMVLDHVREFIHRDALAFQPTDLSRTTTALFLVRWVTHLCAPTFVLLAGVSIRLQRDAGAPGLPRFLVARGMWLIALEATVISFGFDFGWPFLFLQVIWAIGAGSIVLAAALRLPPRAVLASGLALLLACPLVPSAGPAVGTASRLLSTLLLSPGPVSFMPGLVAYPLLPWLGIMAIGYGSAGLFAAGSRRPLALAGLGLLAAFALLRLGGIGDPAPWSPSAHPALSLINVGKYPPSPCFAAVTLGVSLLCAVVLAGAPAAVMRPLDALGRTPFFVYLVHIYLAHGAALAIGVARGLPAGDFANFLSDPSALVRAHWGTGLAGVLLVWLAIVAALWPAAEWMARIKATSRSPLLRFL